MATLETDERNIVEADDVNWRLIVYPLLAIFVVLVGGFGIYYYHLNQREQAEAQARAALVEAKTPQEMVKVADSFPQTTQASVALMNAADSAFAAKDFPSALHNYQRVTGAHEAPAELRDSAQLGLASVQEASGKADEAIQSYLEVARKGSHSPFAPAAYYQVSQIYKSRQDKPGEMDVLQQAVRLGGDSPFIKEAAARLKELQTTPAATAGAAKGVVPAAPSKPKPD